MKKHLSTFEFFDLVMSGEYGQLDIQNYAQLKTDNYKHEKLILFIDDIEYCMFCEKEELIGSFTEDQIESAIENLINNNCEIPYIYFKELRKNGEIVIPEPKSLDLETLLFPYHFLRIRKLISDIKKKLIHTDNLYIDTPIKRKESVLNQTLKDDITKSFEWMLQQDFRKHKQILQDSDFQNLVNWVSSYFEKDFTIPEILDPIKKVNTNKGHIIYAFKKLFSEIHPHLSKPDSLFILITKCFYELRNDNISNHKKLKEPQYYSELVNQRH